jgi:hypothetical protein
LFDQPQGGDKEMPECNLPLPCSSTCSGDTCAFEPAFTISNPLGTAINAVGRMALSAGNPAELGPGGTAIQGSSVFGTGVLGTSAEQIGVIGAGGAAGVQASSERGRAGWFEIGNTNNNSAALFAQTFGGGAAVEGLIPFSSRPGEATGRTGFFRIENPGSDSTALFASTTGGGVAVESVIPAQGNGTAGFFRIEEPGNNAFALNVSTVGRGGGILATAQGGAGQGVFAIAEGGQGVTCVGATGILGVGRGTNSLGGSSSMGSMSKALSRRLRKTAL